MAADAEKCLLAPEKCSLMFKGQDRCIHRAPLAAGVPWISEIWSISEFPSDLLERLPSKGFQVSYKTEFSSFVSYNVELLS